MLEVQIICINKDRGNHANPHEAISHYGWVNSSGKRGKTNRSKMVSWLEKGNQAYVEDKYGNRAYCHIRESIHGNKFLQTAADGKYNNNLLSLPEC